MKCPHCMVHFHDNWEQEMFQRNGHHFNWLYRSADCPECNDRIIQVSFSHWNGAERIVHGWRQIYPVGANRGPVPPEVPAKIAEDYIEACQVLAISPKASAALSRRCLQAVLRSHGYSAPNLAQEIDLLLNETDPSKFIPQTLRVTIDGIRNFGNFSTHPITDLTGLQVIEVEPEEAEWCLEILEESFQHFYVRPAEAATRKAALDAKLQSAGKLPSK